MADTATYSDERPAASQATEHFDVVTVGAGISGVGGAYHLIKQCPGTSFVVLDVMRYIHLFPKQGNKPQWQHTQDYWSDKDALPNANLDDGALVYE